MNLAVNLPEDIARHLQTSWHDLSRGALEAIALEGYRSEALTRDQVGRLLGMSFWEVEAFLKERCAYLAYAEDDLEDDRQAIDRLRRRWLAMVVVSNTSPLNYLVLIGCDHVLPALFGGVLVPETVFNELDSEHAPPGVRRWVSRWPSWADVRPGTSLPAALQSLDGGEAAAIALALTTGAHLVLLDERKGRRVAREHSLRVAGTLGILDSAAAGGLIQLPAALDALAKTSFRISPKLLQQLRSRGWRAS
jgi:predicted nucleic acid-binding protein